MLDYISYVYVYVDRYQQLIHFKPGSYLAKEHSLIQYSVLVLIRIVCTIIVYLYYNCVLIMNNEQLMYYNNRSEPIYPISYPTPIISLNTIN